jgi:hypothetical protein
MERETLSVRQEAGPAVVAVAAASHWSERRGGVDRRRRLWWSLIHGGFWPRRLDGRRTDDHYRPVIDWHGPWLLASCVLVLLMSAADAFLTLKLISLGAVEVNPLMALWVYDDVRTFAIVKMTLTGGAVVALVSIARFRVFRLVRAATFVHGVLVFYTALIAYELSLLGQLAGS